MKLKIYTKQGDQGTTRLGNRVQVSKDDLSIQALGSVDELNSALGVFLSHCTSDTVIKIQHQLFEIGAELCLSNTTYTNIDEDIACLENHIDSIDKYLSPLKNFILPGGNAISAWLFFARAICRRAERDVVQYFNQLESQQIPCNKKIIVYLNRLSDLLFVMGRSENHGADVIWKH